MPFRCLKQKKITIHFLTAYQHGRYDVTSRQPLRERLVLFESVDPHCLPVQVFCRLTNLYFDYLLVLWNMVSAFATIVHYCAAKILFILKCGVMYSKLCILLVLSVLFNSPQLRPVLNFNANKIIWVEIKDYCSWLWHMWDLDFESFEAKACLYSKSF